MMFWHCLCFARARVQHLYHTLPNLAPADSTAFDGMLLRSNFSYSGGNVENYAIEDILGLVFDAVSGA